MFIKDDEIEDRKLNSLARLTLIKVLYHYKYYEIMMIANDLYDKRKHFKIVSLLLK
jgi:hypothetical protein